MEIVEVPPFPARNHFRDDSITHLNISPSFLRLSVQALVTSEPDPRFPKAVQFPFFISMWMLPRLSTGPASITSQLPLAASTELFGTPDHCPVAAFPAISSENL